jgi:tetratricopeptide (TPR) repeat protein
LVLNGSRAAIGAQFFETADLYFHRGVEHTHALAFTNDWFQSLSQEISPEAHVHLHGSDVREIMPWLWLAVRANPHNVDAYIVTAFWLAREARRSDLALDVLREATLNNPRNHRIALEQSRILLDQGHTAAARNALDRGLAFWPGAEPPDSDDARMDRRDLLLHRAFALESLGYNALAVSDLEAILQIYPAMDGLRQRMADLKKGVQPPEKAQVLLQNMLEVEDRARAECPRDHDEAVADESISPH